MKCWMESTAALWKKADEYVTANKSFGDEMCCCVFTCSLQQKGRERVRVCSSFECLYRQSIRIDHFINSLSVVPSAYPASSSSSTWKDREIHLYTFSLLKCIFFSMLCQLFDMKEETDATWPKVCGHHGWNSQSGNQLVNWQKNTVDQLIVQVIFQVKITSCF